MKIKFLENAMINGRQFDRGNQYEIEKIGLQTAEKFESEGLVRIIGRPVPEQVETKTEPDPDPIPEIPAPKIENKPKAKRKG